MYTVVGFLAALLLVWVLVVPSIAGIDTWKVALAIIGFTLLVLSGRNKGT